MFRMMLKENVYDVQKKFTHIVNQLEQVMIVESQCYLWVKRSHKHTHDNTHRKVKGDELNIGSLKVEEDEWSKKKSISLKDRVKKSLCGLK